MEQGGDVLGQFAQVLVGLGLPGVVIAFLALALRVLWTENKDLHRLLHDTSTKGVQAIEQNTAAITRLTELLLRGKDL